jgi:hypothetical protein
MILRYMMLLDPALVRSVPELASLETLTLVLQAALVALTAAHPCLECDGPPCGAFAACHLAYAIHDRIDELDNAILNYRAAAEDVLDEEQNRQLPF